MNTDVLRRSADPGAAARPMPAAGDRSRAGADAARSGRTSVKALAAVLLTLAGGAALAQLLSSPIPGAPARPAVSPAAGTSGTAAPVPGLGPAGLPVGSGAGVHSPDSPYAPLKPRDDVVPWSQLTAVTTRTVNRRLLPVFGPEQLALDGRTVRIQGFMMPLEPGERQRHFLVSSVPLTCAFCIPGGPESMVEVRAKTPVRYAMEPVVLEGRLSVLRDDPYGLYYRLTEAVPVR